MHSFNKISTGSQGNLLTGLSRTSLQKGQNKSGQTNSPYKDETHDSNLPGVCKTKRNGNQGIFCNGYEKVKYIFIIASRCMRHIAG